MQFSGRYMRKTRLLAPNLRPPGLLILMPIYLKKHHVHAKENYVFFPFCDCAQLRDTTNCWIRAFNVYLNHTCSIGHSQNTAGRTSLAKSLMRSGPNNSLVSCHRLTVTVLSARVSVNSPPFCLTDISSSRTAAISPPSQQHRASPNNRYCAAGTYLQAFPPANGPAPGRSVLSCRQNCHLIFERVLLH